MFAGHRVFRDRRPSPSNDRSLSPRSHNPTRSADVTRHQREFPGSRPIPVLPLACGRPGWVGGPWAFPQAPYPTDQEPVTHVAVGTGRTQTCSYIFDIRRTSSTSSLTTCDLVPQRPSSTVPGTWAARPVCPTWTTWRPRLVRATAGSWMLNVSVRAASLRVQPLPGSRTPPPMRRGAGPRPCGSAILGSWP